jgi:hypothetical protein
MQENLIDEGHRTLIFAQTRKMLDIIQVFLLNPLNISYVLVSECFWGVDIPCEIYLVWIRDETNGLTFPLVVEAMWVKVALWDVCFVQLLEHISS